MKFELLIIPPSYNQNLCIDYYKKEVYLSKKAREFKRFVKLHTPHMNIKDTQLLSITVTLYSDWYYKNGKIKKIDARSLDRLLIDAIMERLGIDDSQLFKVTTLKIQAKEDKTIIELTPLNTTWSIQVDK